MTNDRFESVPDDRLQVTDRIVIKDRKPRRCAEVTTFYTYTDQTRTQDDFTVDDFFACLTYAQNGLHLRADYIRGRSMKMDITIRPDGTVTLTTWGRGQSALRWLDKLQGKKLMDVVQSAGESERR